MDRTSSLKFEREVDLALDSLTNDALQRENGAVDHSHQQTRGEYVSSGGTTGMDGPSNVTTEDLHRFTDTDHQMPQRDLEDQSSSNPQCARNSNLPEMDDAHHALDDLTRPLDCEFCGKNFKVVEHLEQHRKTHQLKEKPFTCDDCGWGFVSTASLRQHIKACPVAREKLLQKKKERQIICDDCGQKFISKASLERHSIVHKGMSGLWD